MGLATAIPTSPSWFPLHFWGLPVSGDMNVEIGPTTVPTMGLPKYLAEGGNNVCRLLPVNRKLGMRKLNEGGISVSTEIG